jgi:hypothetical protein
MFNVAFAMTILYLFSLVQLLSLVIMLPRYSSLNISHSPVESNLSLLVMRTVSLPFSLPSFLPHSFPFDNFFQSQSINLAPQHHSFFFLRL